ncbi:iron complex outermembrane recepter protein [Pseudomonas flavescens]|uniref:Iron complex outermembrane recepter protein n=1 Tax=Phytopseudomonas flavescens TaxID=29435 RepID=A0A1G8DYC3_9GAMM|nr:TonB-dependent siderophore receptor [Pseudomonas flavescens]SDH62653.1 iron complex outermembrane recepter protein [Pseudomonas flavescens]
MKRTTGVRQVLALSLLAATVGMQSVHVQAERASHYQIQAGSLDQALNRFAAEAGITVQFTPELTAGLPSPGLNGAYDAQQALAALLAGSGLEAAPQGDGVYVLVRRSDASSSLNLAPSVISGHSGETARGPVEGYVAKRSATGSKTDSAMSEIPQTINVVTQDEIKARGSQSVTEALRYTAGMTSGGFADRVKIFDEPTSRGFTPTPLYLDGLHLPYGGGSTGGSLQIDPYTLERIEVLKGPASVLYGQNQPGGIVNLVSKRPTDQPVHEIVLGGGTQDRKYGAFDFAGSIDDQGEFLYRVTGLLRDVDSQIDYADQNRLLLAPSLTWLPNEQTSLTLFAQYQKDRDTPEAQGLPAEGTLYPSSNGRISRSLYLGEPGLNTYDREQFVVGYELSHQLNDTWTLKQNVRYAYVDDRYVAPLHGYAFPTNPVTGLNDNSYQTRFGVDWAQTNKVFGLDNIAQAKFTTGELEHTLLLGVDYYHFNSTFLGRYDRNGAGIDLYNPVYGSTFTFTGPYRWDNTVTQTGLYTQEQLRWGNWFLTLGGRYDFAETDNKAPLSGSHSNIKDEKFTGRAGLGYQFENGLTPYVSYAESFLPQTGTDAAQNPFEPTTGTQYEAGIKYEPPFVDGFIQLSVYQIDQDNMLTDDLVNSGFSVQSGSVRSRGVELEGKVNVTRNLRVLGSVSRNQIKWRSLNDGREGRTVADKSPLTASAWVDYSFDSGLLAGLGAGLGVRYVRGSYGSDYESDAFKINSYSVYDAMLSYDLQQSALQLQGVGVRLNMENISDKQYVASCKSTIDCYYGQGRTLTADVTYNW